MVALEPTVRGPLWVARGVLAATLLLTSCGDDDPPDSPADSILPGDAEADVLPPPTCVTTATLSMPQVGVDPATGMSETFKLNPPSHVLSLLLTISGEVGVHYALDTLESPTGEALVVPGWLDSASVPSCLECPNRVGSDRTAAAALVPNSPAAAGAVAPGAWQFRIRASDGGLPPTAASSGPVNVAIVFKRGTAAPSAGTVTLDFYLTGAGGVTRSTAQEHPTITAMVTTAEQVWGTAGVTVEVGSFADVPAQYQELDTDSLEELIAHGNEGPIDHIPVFIVDAFTDAASVAGVSLTAGPAGIATARSGIVLAVGAPDPGLVLAHELGHYLGLWHTTELSPKTVHDPLPDTPKGPTDNLMYAVPTGQKLTEEQGRVARRHPLVTHACAQAGGP